MLRPGSAMQEKNLERCNVEMIVLVIVDINLQKQENILQTRNVQQLVSC